MKAIEAVASTTVSITSIQDAAYFGDQIAINHHLEVPFNTWISNVTMSMSAMVIFLQKL